MAFENALGFTLRQEGGKVDDPQDPGGRTNCGITQASFSKWLRVPMENSQDVWTASADQVIAFYRAYWDRAGCQGYDQLDERLGMLMFDASVQHGNALAVQFLQQAIGVEPDGKFGTMTFDAMHTCYEDTPQMLLDDVVMHRKDHYHERALKPQLTKFLEGWLRRIDDLQAVADTQPAALVNVVRHANGSAPLPITTDLIP